MPLIRDHQAPLTPTSPGIPADRAYGTVRPWADLDERRSFKVGGTVPGDRSSIGTGPESCRPVQSLASYAGSETAFSDRSRDATTWAFYGWRPQGDASDTETRERGQIVPDRMRRAVHRVLLQHHPPHRRAGPPPPHPRLTGTPGGVLRHSRLLPGPRDGLPPCPGRGGRCGGRCRRLGEDAGSAGPTTWRCAEIR